MVTDIGNAVNMRLLLFSLLLFFCGQNQLKAQTFIVGDSTQALTGETVEITGRITVSQNGEPLQGATVYVEELERGVSTDSSGYYSLEMPQGKYLVRYRHLRMESVDRQVVIYSSGEIDVTMQEREYDLDEIIVESKRYGDNLRDVAAGVDVVSINNLEQLPMLMGEVNVIQSLKSLTGVNSVGEGASGYNVRGGREDQNLVLMDGVPVINPTHVLGLFSVYQPDVTESYSLFKGHIPERYGGRLSSVLDVKMKQGSTEEYSVKGGVGLYTGRLVAEGPLIKDKTSFLISGRTSWAGWILNMNNPDRDFFRLPLSPELTNSTASFWDINAKIDHRFNEGNLLSASVYGSEDYFRFSEKFGYSWGNRIANMSWKSELSANLFSNLTAGVNFYNSSHFDPSGVEAFQLDNGIGYFKLKEHLIYTGIENHFINGGVEWNRYQSKDETVEPYNENSTMVFDRVGKDNGQTLAFYIGDEIDITSSLSLSMGLRYALYSQLGPSREFSYQKGIPRSQQTVTDTTDYASGEQIVNYRGFEPRISTRYMITSSNSIRMSYNKTSQYIHQISNSTSSTPADIWQPATKFLPPQTADNYSVGYYHNFGENIWETSVEYFYRDIGNLVEYVDFAELFLNEHLETELVSAKGKAYGTEVSVKKTGGDWTGRLSYTYSRTFVRVGGAQEINRGNWYPSNYDQPHNIDLTAKRVLGEKSAFSFNFTWHTGRPITGLVSSYQDKITTIPVFSRRNEVRIPDYLRLDLSFTIAETTDPDRRYQDSININFYNILGRKNAFSIFYERPSETQVPKAYKLSVLGAVIPSITYNFSF